MQKFPVYASGKERETSGDEKQKGSIALMCLTYVWYANQKMEYLQEIRHISLKIWQLSS
jgi:hypothetical protein